MKRIKSLKIFNLILALFLLIFTVGYTFAWFTDQHTTKLDFQVETSGYFASGDGSTTDPFLLTSPVHLYNVAWLQNLGRLQNGGNGYYFKVDNNIDMGNTVIPPIGTADSPFIGNFNGNGKTISNVTVSTNLDVLTSRPDASVSFSNYVGLFGRTGITPVDNIGGKQAVIKNFILNDPLVEVSSVGAYDTSESAPETNANIRAAGLAAGYVYGNITNVAVYKGRLKVDLADYFTANSIIGALHSSVDGSDIGVTEGGGTEGNNVGYLLGTEIYSYLGNPSSALRLTRDNNTDLLLTSKYGYTYDSAIERWSGTAKLNNTESTLGLGLFAVTASRSGIRIRSASTARNITYTTYTYTNDVQSSNTEQEGTSNKLYTYYTDNENDEADRSWGGLLTGKDGGKYQGIMQGTTDYTKVLRHSWRFEAVPDDISSTNTDVVTEEYYNDYAKNDTNSSLTLNSALKTNSIWFNIVDSSNAYVFFVAVSSGTQNLSVNKVLTDTELTTLMKDKARRELEGQDNIEELVNNVDNTDFYFKNDYDIFEGITISPTAVYNNVPINAMSSNTAYAFRFDLSTSKAGAGLYSLTLETGSNTDIYYIKASGVNDGSSGSGGGTEVANAITDVDFVNTLTMEYDESTETFANFTKLETRIYFGTSSIVILWFERSTTSSSNITVFYNGTDAPLASNSSYATIENRNYTITITRSGTTDTNTEM